MENERSLQTILGEQKMRERSFKSVAFIGLYFLKTKNFVRIILAAFLLTFFSSMAAIAWGPTDIQPHKDGILRKKNNKPNTNTCSLEDVQSGERNCLSGLKFPSFNNYLDGSGTWRDERQFFKVSNDGTTYSDELKVSNGEYLVFAAMVHNNAQDGRYPATGVVTGIRNNIFHLENKWIVTQWSNNGVLKVTQFINAENSTPKSIWDTVTLTSDKEFRLRYKAGNLFASEPGGSILGHFHNEMGFFINGGMKLGDRRNPASGTFIGSSLYVHFKAIVEGKVVVASEEFRPTRSRSDTTPPSISILEPEVQRGIVRRHRKEHISIKGSATDDSGLEKILINNKLIPHRKDGSFSEVFTLKKGNNQITIQAEDIHGNTATENLSVKFLPDSSPIDDDLEGWYANQYALIAGINIYRNGNIPQLRNAVQDAKSIAKIFKSNKDFEVTELYGSQATRSALIRAIAEIQEKAGKSDGFLFYFAGHGQGIELKNKRLEGYLIPYDADLSLDRGGAILYDEEAISLSRLRTYAQDFSAKHIVLILDSCFSGLAMKRTIPRFPAMTKDYYNDLLARKAINILTAGDAQPVSDGTGHSPFTQALLNALARANIDLHDRDGFATFNQLAVYVKEKVEKTTGRRQRPQFDNLSMDDGEYVFRMR